MSYYSIMIMVPPYTIHLRYTTATPKHTHFYHFNDGRMAVSPHTRVLQTKIRCKVPKEGQDDGLSAGMSYGRQTLPRRPSGRNRDISHTQWDISQQKTRRQLIWKL